MAKKKKNKVVKASMKKGLNPVEKKVLMELLYMTPEKVVARDLEKAITEEMEMEVHVWEELDILEVTLSSGQTVDIETMTEYIDDPLDLEYMKERNVQTIYAVTVEEVAMEEFLPIMRIITEKLGGFLCSDSDDFMPEYSL